MTVFERIKKKLLDKKGKHEDGDEVRCMAWQRCANIGAVCHLREKIFPYVIQTAPKLSKNLESFLPHLRMHKSDVSMR